MSRTCRNCERGTCPWPTLWSSTEARCWKINLSELERLAFGISLTGDAGPSLRARVLATGELMLTVLGHAFLASQGIPATWKDARSLLRARTSARAPLHENFLTAQCDYEPDSALQATESPVIITQGFIASNEAQQTVLIGWGGSDTSGAYFAAKLEAVRLEIWTDVPGMFTANPNLVPGARLLRQLQYDEAQELASAGAEVLHPRCIDPLRKAGIPLHVRSTAKPGNETVRSSALTYSTMGPRSRLLQRALTLTLIAMETPRMWHSVGFLAQTFDVFARHGISIGLVATSETNVTVSIDPIRGVPLDHSVIEALLADLDPGL